LTAIRNEDAVEVSEAYRAIILEDVPPILVFGRVLVWVLVYTLNVLLEIDSVDPHLIAVLHWHQIGLPDFFHDPSLLFEIELAVYTW
jgi:hypothetical protein